MVDITILEVRFGDGLTADLPFGRLESGDGTDDADEDEAATAETGGKGRKLLVATAVFLLLAAGAAAVKFLTGGDDADVAIDADDEPVGVPVGDE